MQCAATTTTQVSALSTECKMPVQPAERLAAHACARCWLPTRCQPPLPPTAMLYPTSNMLLTSYFLLLSCSAGGLPRLACRAAGRPPRHKGGKGRLGARAGTGAGAPAAQPAPHTAPASLRRAGGARGAGARAAAGQADPL